MMVLLCALILSAVPAAAGEEAPAVSAEAAILMDRDSGRIIFEKNADRSLEIASTTKIMTAVVVLERCKPEQEVHIRPEWTHTEGSSMYLRPGGTYTVEELLTGLLLVSGNDAARALACHAAGSEEAFAVLMNEKARELGMEGSHFMNPHGLSQEGHYATARDLGVLTCHALRNPDFAGLCATRYARVQGVSMTNHNKLLWQYEGASGVKTGYTKAAGRALVSCAQREDTGLVCVTLNDPDDWRDHAALLDWGFAHYESRDLSGENWLLPVVSGTEEQVSVRVKEGSRVFLEKGEDCRLEVRLPQFVYAPVYAGERAGSLQLRSAEGKLLYEAELVYGSSVPLDGAVPLNFWEKLRWSWYFACRNGYQSYPVYPFC